MRKFYLLFYFLLVGCCSLAFGQKKHKDALFSLLLETEIRPFIPDSSEIKTEWENESFVTVYSDFRTAVAKTWKLSNGETLVGLLLNNVDNVMNHQRVKFFFYKNQQLVPAPVTPALHLSMFFEETYLRKNEIDPLQDPEDPEFAFYPNNNRISVHLQPEVFDSTYMGQNELTRLDPDKIACADIFLEPNQEGKLKVVSRKYATGELELEILGGWETGCALSGSFVSMGNNRYFFSNEIDPIGPNLLQLIMGEDYDSLKVTRRLAYAYGKLRSETEGIGFYDTSFAGNRDMTWYTFSDFLPVESDSNHTFSVSSKTPPNAMLKTPAVSPKMAEAWFKKESPDGYDLAPGLDETTRKTRRLKLYAYLIEIEVSFLKDNQKIRKTLLFKLRHGEC